jgi:hypothetical protein
MNRLVRPFSLALLLACLHAAWQLAFVQPAVSVPEGHDHLGQARLLAAEGRPWLEPPDIPTLVPVPGPDHLLDLVLDGRPFYLVRWTLRGPRLEP